MRTLLSPTIGGIVRAAVIATAAVAASALPGSHSPAAPPRVVLVDARCGQGWHYVPEGYAEHGKWRDAHCSRN